jgi:hypothetical protein
MFMFFPLMFSLPAELWSPMITVKQPPHATSYAGMELQAYGGTYTHHGKKIPWRKIQGGGRALRTVTVNYAPKKESLPISEIRSSHLFPQRIEMKRESPGHVCVAYQQHLVRNAMPVISFFCPIHPHFIAPLSQ